MEVNTTVYINDANEFNGYQIKSIYNTSPSETEIYVFT